MPVENAHDPDTDGQDSTWFGFRRIEPGQKAALVQGVFSSVAGKYDLMNDLMSGGIHRLWKSAMLDWLNPRPGWNSLDVAGGTGDIAFRILERQPSAHVTVCDLTPAMLEVGRDRAIDKGILSGLDWVSGNAEDLPFEEMRFDSYTIAFGLRNVGRQQRALEEAYRTLRPGGRFLCLEFSHVGLPALAKLYDVYSFKVLPWLGQQVAGDRDSYQYLVESIRKFPTQDNLAGMMSAAGFRNVTYRNLTGGIAALHSGWRV
ncbi:MAG: bifunctional demethylmenaquinone methyltransferase/2-methoxy-6-polyprenyl-1,4-benzoquinol methylase UbiE [Rhodospirillaceae bacterium]|nr:bifunctional demethylmenaquinone methyltransferase/2-methoxy-6-polyprenyl-1,4-benzoquinol methylase UbiE [Rhodospirillaceae bacterium]